MRNERIAPVKPGVSAAVPFGAIGVAAGAGAGGTEGETFGATFGATLRAGFVGSGAVDFIEVGNRFGGDGGVGQDRHSQRPPARSDAGRVISPALGSDPASNLGSNLASNLGTRLAF